MEGKCLRFKHKKRFGLVEGKKAQKKDLEYGIRRKWGTGQPEAPPCQVDSALTGKFLGACGTCKDKWKHPIPFRSAWSHGEKIGFGIFMGSNPSNAFC